MRRLALRCGCKRAFGVGAGLAEDALLVQRLLADGALAGIGREALACAQRLVAAAGARALLAAGCAARPVLPLRGKRGGRASARQAKASGARLPQSEARQSDASGAGRTGSGQATLASFFSPARAGGAARGASAALRRAARRAARAAARRARTFAAHHGDPAAAHGLGAARARLNGTTRVVRRTRARNLLPVHALQSPARPGSVALRAARPAMHRGSRAPLPRSIASFFGGGLAAARPAAPLPRAQEPAPAPRFADDVDAADAAADAALPARAEFEPGGCSGDGAAEDVFASAAPPAAGAAAASPPPQRVFSRKRRASAPADGCVPLAARVPLAKRSRRSRRAALRLRRWPRPPRRRPRRQLAPCLTHRRAALALALPRQAAGGPPALRPNTSSCTSTSARRAPPATHASHARRMHPARASGRRGNALRCCHGARASRSPD